MTRARGDLPTRVDDTGAPVLPDSRDDLELTPQVSVATPLAVHAMSASDGGNDADCDVPLMPTGDWTGEDPTHVAAQTLAGRAGLWVVVVGLGLAVLGPLITVLARVLLGGH